MIAVQRQVVDGRALPYDRNKFFAREIDAMIIFNSDKNGNVVSLTKIQGGEMVAKRID